MWLQKSGNAEKKEEGNGLVAVAIDKDKGSQHALKWAVDHVLQKGQTVILVHVKLRAISSLSGTPVGRGSMSGMDSVISLTKQLIDQPSKELFLPFLCFCTRKDVVTMSGASETDILNKFKLSLANADVPLKNWNGVPCKGNISLWTGVICTDQGTVWGLQLESMGLSGIVDIETLVDLPNLRTISIMNNRFEGPIPDIKKLSALKTLYLSNNSFSGHIPGDAFTDMVWLKKLYLAHNQFTGPIPWSLTKLPKLIELMLNDNQLQGRIPDFPQKSLQLVNVSNNQLHGPIPPHLRKIMNSTSLVSGNNLCGAPLSACPGKKMSKSTIVIIIVVAVVGSALLLLAAVYIILRRRRQKSPKMGGRGSTQSLSKAKKLPSSKGIKKGSSENFSTGKKSDHGKLVFVREDREKFDLNDLLRASAEVLGSGTFGSSYKATLLSGPAMVVKRFRHMNNVGREDFQEHMKRLGKLRHPNLLTLVAYYYRKEEKLLVTDFINNGSLAYHLHGNRTPGSPALDWPTRLNIIKGIAKGLIYLYNELPNVGHGHLKSSNVLLNVAYEPILTDYCLLPVINKEHAIEFMVAYKSPEYAQHGRLSKKTDVWSLGILILEMLTGKFPENYVSQGKGGNKADLAKWVNSVVREEWTGEVFDKDMKGTKNGEGEMLKLLKIALGCCEMDLDRRWTLKEAVEKIEELNERDNESDDYSSFASEGDVYSSSRAMTDDDFSFSMNA
ncbi:Pollen receptor-like kinase [Thalictrum thalictroides]|uniref:non-specific serine/threonine protein kinase n=1 Tax=Thalictrum thalictroides TaxID=46969 RepID=A0A7J6V188_THATH|nr:Pollen receptor-like kinase [Thalictrum thalictroides]